MTSKLGKGYSRCLLSSYIFLTMAKDDLMIDTAMSWKVVSTNLVNTTKLDDKLDDSPVMDRICRYW